MNVQRLDQEIKVDMAVQTAEGSELGTVAEVWPDVGVGESWGAVGSIPQREAEATDVSQYAFSESMPGEGDSYFRVTTKDGDDLYIPFAAVSQADGRGGHRCLWNEASVPGMQWDVMLTSSRSNPSPIARAARTVA